MFQFSTPSDPTLAAFSCHAGMRFYRLHPPHLRAPRTRLGRARGLVLLLHGCGQRPDRFAEATGLEAQAARMGWITLTPQQSRRKNVLGCWNWFDPAHRARTGGEAEILASLVRATAAAHDVPEGAIFVAGFSAGAAMALALADAYPELFAAACVHSGVHYAGIRDGEAAAAAMRGEFDHPAPGPRRGRVPVLVIQGTEDRIVHPANARRITAGRGRHDRLLMVRGAGHEWSAKATAEAVGFFRRHATASGAMRLGARLIGLSGHAHPLPAAELSAAELPINGAGGALRRLGQGGTGAG